MILFLETHLSERIYAHRPTLREDSYRALMAVTEWLSTRKPEDIVGSAVVFCGDSFDTPWPSPDDEAALRKFLRYCSANGLMVYGIQGNHDKCSKRSWLEINGICMLRPDELAIVGGVTLRGFDHKPWRGPHEVMHDMVVANQECDILVMHQALRAVNNRETEAIDPKDIPSTVKLAVVAGHTHTGKVWRDGPLVYASPGCTHRRKIDEPPGTMLVYDNTCFTIVELGQQRPIKRISLDNTSRASAEAYFAGLRPLTEIGVDNIPLVELSVSPEDVVLLLPFKRYSDRCHLLTSIGALRESPTTKPTATTTAELDLREIIGEDPVMLEFMSGLLSDGILMVEALDTAFEKERKDKELAYARS